MIKEFNSLDEIQKYYNEDANTYIFKEDGKYIDLVVFNFDLDVEANTLIPSLASNKNTNKNTVEQNII